MRDFLLKKIFGSTADAARTPRNGNLPKGYRPACLYTLAVARAVVKP